MRAVFFVMLGLGLIAEPAFAARTSPRTSGSAVVAAKPKVAPPVATKSRGAAPAATAAKSRGGTQATAGKRGAVATRSGRGPRFTAYRGGVSRASAATLTRSVRWSDGLPPAAGIQAGGCPSGTMATLARGHGDVVRCMPI